MNASGWAQLVWSRHCDGRPAGEVEPVVLLVDGQARAKRLSLDGFHPAEFIDALAPLPSSVEWLVLVTAGSFRRFHPSTLGPLPDGWLRSVAVVGRDGSSLTLGCVDGEDGPRVQSSACGGVWAAMQMAFIPTGELDAVLAAILDKEGKAT